MSDDKPVIGMLKVHKNGFIDIIKDSGLDPGQFRMRESDGKGSPTIIISYKGTPFSFGLETSEDSLYYFKYAYTQLAPNFPSSSIQPHDHIDSVFDRFEEWLRDQLKPFLEDQETPDLWAQIQSQTPVVSDEPVGSDDREQFTQREQDQIQMAINEFRQIVTERHAPSEEQLRLINNRLDYLREQVPLLNRINWRALALGTLIAVIIQLSLGQEQGKELLELGQRIFSNIVPLLPQ